MSEQKLKALKVVELKDILSKAAVSVPAKANKQDLIARILANSTALDVYRKLQNPAPAPPAVQQTNTADDLLAPPEDFDWEGDVTSPAVPPTAKVTQSSKPPTAEPAKPAKTTKPASKSAAKPPPSPAKKPAAATPAKMAAEPAKDDAAVVDEELEKRKKRAARFGVPLVEAPKPRAQLAAKSGSNTPRKASATPTTTSIDDPEKLRARAARFGQGSPKPAHTKPANAKPGNTQPANAKPANTTVKKRQAEEEVDPEELERRKKRAARFGMPMTTA